MAADAARPPVRPRADVRPPAPPAPKRAQAVRRPATRVEAARPAIRRLAVLGSCW